MAQVYTNSNYGVPVGVVADYNNTNPSREISRYRTISTSTPHSFAPTANHSDFAFAIYGNGPFSLTCPNNASDTLAQNIDYNA